ncbi:serine/threonine-protein kinase [Arenibaculum pallidiluteum]|uniref:serine/threonine protein kinase n=1 Tax=Arenibaculum pallidiluteum TaxID=2812559 RepID=UPI001F20C0F1|nr:serine/threonine protein kinase [Arenibaculum pallidiluteum]
MAFAEAADAPTAAAMDAVVLNNRVEILPGSPLPALNAPGGPAFLARAVRDRKAELFAIVCTSGLPPRTDMLTSLKSIETQSLMRLLDWGVIDWPADGHRRFALIFERPSGRRVMSALSETIEPMGEERVTRQVIQPLAAALKELGVRGIVHGDVRPTNLFVRDQATGGVMLGECISTLPSYTQPAIFLPIERAMAQPGGRGAGSTADDLYALGVTALVMLLGRNPARQLDDEAMLQAKIEKGTYPALVGTMRISLSMMEVLRGLLSDDVKQRWTLSDVDMWLSGRRLSPKQPQVPRKGVRPFEFQDGEAWHARSLGRLLARAPGAAALQIDSGELDRWLRRSLGDEVRAEAVQGAVASATAAGKSGSFEERLVARVCLALDPPAPIRYKQRSVMVDGFGHAIAEAFALGQSPQALGEAIAAQLPMFWVNVQLEAKAEFVPLIQTFDQMRSYLERQGLGFGIERVLYELNPTMACISPMVKAFHAQSPLELLQALDQVATRVDRGKEPIDRHVAGFLGARFRKLDERLLSIAGNGGESGRRVTAILNILGEVQTRFGPANLPNLSGWLATMVEPALERFHSRPRREKMKADLVKAARSGDIRQLLKLIDDPEAVRKDEMGFAAARRDYDRAAKEIQRAEREIENRQETADTLGRQIAAMVSSVLATVALVGIVIVYLMRR